MDNKETRTYIDKLEFENQALRQDMDATIKNAKIFQAEYKKVELLYNGALSERDNLLVEVGELRKARDEDTEMIAGLELDLGRVRAANVKLIEERDALRLLVGARRDLDAAIPRPLAQAINETHRNTPTAYDAESNDVRIREDIERLTSAITETERRSLEWREISYKRFARIEKWISGVVEAGKLPIE